MRITTFQPKIRFGDLREISCRTFIVKYLCVNFDCESFFLLTNKLDPTCAWITANVFSVPLLLLLLLDDHTALLSSSVLRFNVRTQD